MTMLLQELAGALGRVLEQFPAWFVLAFAVIQVLVFGGSLMNWATP